MAILEKTFGKDQNMNSQFFFTSGNQMLIVGQGKSQNIESQINIYKVNLNKSIDKIEIDSRVSLKQDKPV